MVAYIPTELAGLWVSEPRSRAQHPFPIFPRNNSVTFYLQNPRELLMLSASFGEILGHPTSLHPLLLSRGRPVLFTKMDIGESVKVFAG